MSGLDTELYSEILPGLWQGGTDDFDTVDFPKKFPRLNETKQFDSVATLYAAAQPMGWGVAERRFGFPDAELDEKYLPEIHSIADWVYGEWKQGKRVLTRCQAGWNRSGLVAALVLLQDGFNADEAISLIRERRSPNALCNQHFVNYIKEVYEGEFKESALTA